MLNGRKGFMLFRPFLFYKDTDIKKEHIQKEYALQISIKTRKLLLVHFVRYS
jgi:hypothetical protein